MRQGRGNSRGDGRRGKPPASRTAEMPQECALGDEGSQGPRGLRTMRLDTTATSVRKVFATVMGGEQEASQSAHTCSEITPAVEGARRI